jgi:SAM-dependent methyltransferase
MPDVHTRYAASAEHYERYRPSYPVPLIDWVLGTTGVNPPARIADIGCGTGIATRMFAARGFDTIGIDPSEDMLHFARRGGLARYLSGEATALPLEDQSIDLVVAAQCFHWFDLEPTLRELRRVLRPDGWSAAFWNLRGRTPLMEEYYALIRQYCSEYRTLERQEEAPAALRQARGVASCQEAEFTNAQTLDREGLVGRAYSSSCVTNGVDDKVGFEDALGALFDRHERDGRIWFHYRTVALCWQTRGV